MSFTWVLLYEGLEQSRGISGSECDFSEFVLGQMWLVDPSQVEFPLFDSKSPIGMTRQTHDRDNPRTPDFNRNLLALHQDWVDDIGEAAAIHHQMEVRFRPHAPNPLQNVERETSILGGRDALDAASVAGLSSSLLQDLLAEVSTGIFVLGKRTANTDREVTTVGPKRVKKVPQFLFTLKE
ncbi:hypothetical protein BS47DRAFT_110887 [Hydnum rufescens UP504]|uniref:Uncharacterized protein n=1 Tax=Hydnum rufescens UP504 TaxID=1448309 RepID=A0A9P6AQ95_9AGAM|nr:hypothetical protein BS47DRAFT_110887 [Hydnum rufescens UP504]